jgi:hypothetical protein
MFKREGSRMLVVIRLIFVLSASLAANKLTTGAEWVFANSCFLTENVSHKLAVVLLCYKHWRKHSIEFFELCTSLSVFIRFARAFHEVLGIS